MAAPNTRVCSARFRFTSSSLVAGRLAPARIALVLTTLRNSRAVSALAGDAAQIPVLRAFSAPCWARCIGRAIQCIGTCISHVDAARAEPAPLSLYTDE